VHAMFCVETRAPGPVPVVLQNDSEPHPVCVFLRCDVLSTEAIEHVSQSGQ